MKKFGNDQGVIFKLLDAFSSSPSNQKSLTSLKVY